MRSKSLKMGVKRDSPWIHSWRCSVPSAGRSIIEQEVTESRTRPRKCSRIQHQWDIQVYPSHCFFQRWNIFRKTTETKTASVGSLLEWGVPAPSTRRSPAAAAEDVAQSRRCILHTTTKLQPPQLHKPTTSSHEDISKTWRFWSDPEIGPGGLCLRLHSVNSWESSELLPLGSNSHRDARGTTWSSHTTIYLNSSSGQQDLGSGLQGSCPSENEPKSQSQQETEDWGE